MNKSLIKLFDFLNRSTSPYHAVEAAEATLQARGFLRLEEQTPLWPIEWGKAYYVIRSDASICAFTLPEKILGALLPIAAIGTHTDSPCLTLKSNPIRSGAQPSSLNLEIYGGALYNSWLDRDLRLAGLVWGKDSEGRIQKKRIQTPSWLRIPQLAIHLDRGVNQNGLKLNPQTEMTGICGTSIDNTEFIEKIKEMTGFQEILNWELYTSDVQEAALGGINNEYIYGGRLDNLAMMHSSLEALPPLSSTVQHMNLWVSFNHEEIGSESFEGARSNFLESLLTRVYDALQVNLAASMAQSLFISADMAHAWHPGYPDRFDPDHHPVINKGPVIKKHAHVRYGTAGSGHAFVKNLCLDEEIPHQIFHSRNDLSCGSTIGPACASQLGIQVVDLGNPMFSMHSAREMSGALDVEPIEKLFRSFYLKYSDKGVCS